MRKNMNFTIAQISEEILQVIERASQAVTWKEQAQFTYEYNEISGYKYDRLECFTCDESHNLYQMEGALYRFDFAMQGTFSIL